jgi:hypothetical protein
MPRRREVFCPAYRFCLDAAVEYNRNFSCCSCTQPVKRQRDAISFEELLGCCLLLRTVFFRKKIVRRQAARCPKCGRHHTVYAGSGASSKRFCAACNTYIATYMGDYEAGQTVEVRSGHRLPAAPLDAEPGVED